MGQINTANQTFAAAETYATGTCSSNAVTINAQSGTITTESLTTAANATQAIAVTCNQAAATSRIRVWLQDYAGTFSTNGIPVVNADAAGSGSFTVQVSNAHGANALSGVLKIGFEILPALI